MFYLRKRENLISLFVMASSGMLSSHFSLSKGKMKLLVFPSWQIYDLAGLAAGCFYLPNAKCFKEWQLHLSMIKCGYGKPESNSGRHVTWDR